MDDIYNCVGPSLSGGLRMRDIFELNPIIYNYKKRYILGIDDSSIKVLLFVAKHGITVEGFVCDEKENTFFFGLPVFSSDTTKDGVVLVWINSENACIEEVDVASAVVINESIREKQIVVYGAGNKSRILKELFANNGLSISFYIDREADRIKDGIEKPVYNPLKLIELISNTHILILTVRLDEVIKTLNKFLPAGLEVFCYSEYDSVEMFEGADSFKLSSWEVADMQLALKGKNVYLVGTKDKVSVISGFLRTLQNKIVKWVFVDDTEQNEVVQLIQGISNDENAFLILCNRGVFDDEDLVKEYGLSRGSGYEIFDRIKTNRALYRRTILDVNCGHTVLNDDVPGMVVLGARDRSVPIIVTLGGSATDETLYSFKSWVYCLWELFEKNVTIYNMAINGYDSSQELVRFIRDALLVNPDVVISYSGFNDESHWDYQFENGLSGFENEYLAQVFEYVNNHYECDAGCKPYQGEKSAERPFFRWVNNMSIMKSVCDSRGIRFLGILQPCLEIKKIKNSYEMGIDNTYRCLRRNGYSLDSFYDDANEYFASDECKNGLYDFSHIFDCVDNIYIDDCHINENGNYLVANRIRNLFEI